MQAAEHQMMQLYYRGELAMEEYMNFTPCNLSSGVRMDEVNSWMEVVLRQDIVPRLFPTGQARLEFGIGNVVTGC